MEMARPTLIVTVALAVLTLWYTGQWAGKDPRTIRLPLEKAVAYTVQR